MKYLTALLLTILLIASARPAAALIITRNFISSGDTFPGTATTATGAPTTVAGGGNLQDIFNEAADIWESIILDSHNVTISYGWDGLSSGTLGVHVLQAEGGTPHRETAAYIRFDSDNSSRFFMDPTPDDDSEWSTLTETSADYGGGSINNGRYLTGYSGPLVSGFTPHDMLQIAVHEIGHALGLSSANNSFVAENGDLDIDVQAPRPHAGSVIPTISGAHINVGNGSTGAVMYPSLSSGSRKYPTTVDILANAEISEFNSLNLDFFADAATLTSTPLSASTIDFGTLSQNATADLNDAITHQNSGDSGTMIEVLTAAITGTDAALFELIGGFSPSTLESGAIDSADYDLRFLGSPTPGDYTADLAFTFDGGFGPVSYTLEATVSGASSGGEVPEPGSLLCFMAFAGLLAGPCRRQAKLRRSTLRQIA